MVSVEGRPSTANQTIRKAAWAISVILNATVTRCDHKPISLIDLTILVDMKTPTANANIEIRIDITSGALLPAALSPRKAMLPVINAVNTLPNAMKLITSIDPDENVNA